ncbi:hypothetical protein [Natrarchaeobaculum aegyptiacum]|uniref:Uncharacterized protein n=1 Tax=Natrarchaeobaculum aegyptiacum TaxID=745377 RepID=A0A2Z2I115_9EURY|nr:hypothetical protein [Natrarchaeobaculum aegyptiacum]ARS90008.1 hypothetical protein B1756_09885 [Natrarchaeobaculum aegyptiacum]
MSDGPGESTDDDCTTSDSDGEVEIEVTSGRADESEARTDPEGDPTDPGESRHGNVPRETGRERHETDLADELGRIDVMTTPEGYVEGQIADVAAVDATTVELVVSLPHGETTAFTLEKPIPWSEEFLLARIVEDVGYDAASIDYVVGEPIYLERTDSGPEKDDWWSLSIAAAGDAALTSLSGGRFRLERERERKWDLVDPLERADGTADGDDRVVEDLAGAGLVVLGTILAAIGAVVGATGGVVFSSAVVGYALVGLLLVLFGLAVLLRSESGD